jgi:hypothetical protein
MFAMLTTMSTTQRAVEAAVAAAKRPIHRFGIERP